MHHAITTMRSRLNLTYLVLGINVVLLCLLYFSLRDVSHVAKRDSTSTDVAANSELRRFRCLIEGTKKLQCVRDGSEVFLPFYAFLKKQFDLSGKLNKGNQLH